jgi:diacylglycerol kinase (ATP)
VGTLDCGMSSEAMKYLAVVNPASRSGRTASIVGDLESLLSVLGPDIQIRVSEKRGEARDIARENAGSTDVIIVVGGDGTVHEVGTGLLDRPRGAAMAVLPSGTGNDFARMLGMDTDLKIAVRQLMGASLEYSDAGHIEFFDSGGQHSTHFINAIGIGFDGYAASLAPRYKHLPFKSGYLVTVLRSLLSWNSSMASIMDLSKDDSAGRDPFDRKMFMMTIGNAMDSGGGFRINPKASLTDGLLDVCLVSHVGLFRALQLLPSAARGSHLVFPEVEYWHSGQLQVDSEMPVPIHADGEILTLGATRINVRVKPGVLPVLAPDPSRI